MKVAGLQEQQCSTGCVACLESCHYPSTATLTLLLQPLRTAEADLISRWTPAGLLSLCPQESIFSQWVKAMALLDLTTNTLCRSTKQIQSDPPPATLTHAFQRQVGSTVEPTCCTPQRNGPPRHSRKQTPPLTAAAWGCVWHQQLQPATKTGWCPQSAEPWCLSCCVPFCRRGRSLSSS